MKMNQLRCMKNGYYVKLVKRSEYFDENWYRQQSGITAEEDAALHYVTQGWRKWSPSESFNHEAYLEANLDVQKVEIPPLVHYLIYGEKEGRKLRLGELKFERQKYKAHPVLRRIKREVSSVVYRNQIEKNRNARILVCLQMFYPESWEEIHEYLKNLRDYAFDLVITYQKDLPFAQVLPVIVESYPEARIIEVNNIGFDIGAFYTSIQGVCLDDYDIVYKIHSKGIHRDRLYMYNQLFKKRDWFIYLFEGILGAGNVHKTIDCLMNDAQCGMVAAENLFVHDPKHKQNLVRESLKAHEIECDIPQDYRYVAGTCFAVRAQLLKVFQDRELPFAESRRGRFSLAHCIERAMCFSAQTDGFKLKGMKACSLRRGLRRLQSWNEGNRVKDDLLKDKRFILDDEFVYRSIEPKKIRKYEIVHLRLGDVKRRWFDGKVYNLTECAPFKYLQGAEGVYEEYSEFHEKHNLPAMSKERYGELIHSIKESGFDERYIIVVDQDNIVLDGQHRACILLNQHGEDHRIKVLKVYFDHQVFVKGMNYLKKHGVMSTLIRAKQYLNNKL